MLALCLKKVSCNETTVGINLDKRVPSKELRERLGLDDIISGLQQESL